MLVSLQDGRDVAQNVRFYLGLAASPAACDRYDYKQKFTYWAVLVGIALMALTGFMLWFPMETAGLLPAPIIPLAASLHSHYALVILLVVAVWHNRPRAIDKQYCRWRWCCRTWAQPQ